MEMSPVTARRAPIRLQRTHAPRNNCQAPSAVVHTKDALETGWATQEVSRSVCVRKCVEPKPGSMVDRAEKKRPILDFCELVHQQLAHPSLFHTFLR